MDVTDFGCRIVRICMPDRDGVIDDVVVGYGDLETFENADRFPSTVLCPGEKYHSVTQYRFYAK